MTTHLYLFASLSGLFFVSCRNDTGLEEAHHLPGQTARFELLLTADDANASSDDSLLIDDVTGERKLKNIVIGIFKDERVLSVQNIISPGVGEGFADKNVITCPLKGLPAAECTAVVLANVFSSTAIVSLKSAVSKARFLSVKIPLYGGVKSNNCSSSHLVLYGHVRNTNRHDSLTFTLTEGKTTPGLSVKLRSMASHSVACKVNAY